SKTKPKGRLSPISTIFCNERSVIPNEITYAEPTFRVGSVFILRGVGKIFSGRKRSLAEVDTSAFS
ncbi:MAG: hypothetical protein ACI4SK_00005, partial [Christensenellales bacterium]